MKTCNTCGYHGDNFWTRSAKCIPCVKSYRKNRRQHPETRAKILEQDRKYHLKALYGITPEKYEEMLTAQGGMCAICGTDESKHTHERLVVDHDHATGEVRALLCNPCNWLVGIAQENIGILTSAAAYLMTSSDILGVEKVSTLTRSCNE